MLKSAIRIDFMNGIGVIVCIENGGLRRGKIDAE